MTKENYIKRNNKLIRHGYSSYHDFLSSELWESIKTSLRSRPQSKICYFCGSTYRINLHHCRYSRITLSSAKYILPCCSECHTSIHKIEWNEGLSVLDATKKWRDGFKVTKSSEKALTRSFFRKFWGTNKV